MRFKGVKKEDFTTGCVKAVFIVDDESSELKAIEPDPKRYFIIITFLRPADVFILLD